MNTLVGTVKNMSYCVWKIMAKTWRQKISIFHTTYKEQELHFDIIYYLLKCFLSPSLDDVKKAILANSLILVRSWNLKHENTSISTRRSWSYLDLLPMVFFDKYADFAQYQLEILKSMSLTSTFEFFLLQYWFKS